MGGSMGRGDAELNEEDLKRCFELDYGLDMTQNRSGDLRCDAMGPVSIIDANDPDRVRVQQFIFDPSDPARIAGSDLERLRLGRAIGCLLGNAIGDATGAPFEFTAVRYGTNVMTEGLDQTEIWGNGSGNSFGLEPGQWTDDFSMANAMAESILARKPLGDGTTREGQWDGIDCRLRFNHWWSLGYCNAFGFSEKRGSSIGLGGNISMSISEFPKQRKAKTDAGDKVTSGNGSLMRLGPIPVAFWRDLANAEDTAALSSYTTHQGIEAAECCRLATHIVATLIRSGGGKAVLANLPNTFSTPAYTVRCLAAAQQEERHEENTNLKLIDRNWTWKNPDFRYSPSRSAQQPGYVGSYAMDNLSMALHCVWSTDNFKDAMLKCANMRGDSDSVCAVVGQIAGAMYGVHTIPPGWIRKVQQWDREGDIALKGYKLYRCRETLEATPEPQEIAPLPVEPTTTEDAQE